MHKKPRNQDDASGPSVAASATESEASLPPRLGQSGKCDGQKAAVAITTPARRPNLKTETDDRLLARLDQSQKSVGDVAATSATARMTSLAVESEKSAADLPDTSHKSVGAEALAATAELKVSPQDGEGKNLAVAAGWAELRSRRQPPPTFRVIQGLGKTSRKRYQGRYYHT